MFKSVMLCFFISASTALGQDPHPWDVDGLPVVVVKDSVRHWSKPTFSSIYGSRILGHLSKGTKLTVIKVTEPHFYGQSLDYEGPFAKFRLESGQEVIIYVDSPYNPVVKVIGAPFSKLWHGGDHPLLLNTNMSDGYFTEPREE